MGQKANCCNTQNQMNEEQESEIYTDSNISGFSHISNNNLGMLNDSSNISNKKSNYFNV